MNQYKNYNDQEIDDNSPFRVYIRIRPQLDRNKDDKPCLKVLQTNRSLVVNANDSLHQFTFDNIFRENEQQQGVFIHSCVPVLKQLIEGKNGAYLVYGQTGTGKTYTMGLLTKIYDESQGMVSLSLKYLFDHFQQNQNEKDIFDLLNPEGKKLQIREDTSNNEVFVEDLVTVPVKDLDQAITLINAGLSYRTMGTQNMNNISSRSHTILTIYLTQKINNNEYLLSNVSFIDLAGSERIKKTHSKGIRLEEAKFINTSLSALSNVISALSSEKPDKHIPYRTSKLTRILQNSLTQNSKVVVVGTVSLSQENCHESYSTLLFASKCKNIQFIQSAYKQNNIITIQEDKEDQEELVEKLRLKIENSIIQEQIQDKCINEIKEKNKLLESKIQYYEGIIESHRQKSMVDQSPIQEPGYSDISDTQETIQLKQIIEYVFKLLAKLNQLMDEKISSAKSVIKETIEQAQNKLTQNSTKYQNEIEQIKQMINQLQILDQTYQIKNIEIKDLDEFLNYTVPQDYDQIIPNIQKIAKQTVDNLKIVCDSALSHEKIKVELTLEKMNTLKNIQNSFIDLDNEVFFNIIQYQYNCNNSSLAYYLNSLQLPDKQMFEEYLKSIQKNIKNKIKTILWNTGQNQDKISTRLKQCWDISEDYQDNEQLQLLEEVKSYQKKNQIFAPNLSSQLDNNLKFYKQFLHSQEEKQDIQIQDLTQLNVNKDNDQMLMGNPLKLQEKVTQIDQMQQDNSNSKLQEKENQILNFFDVQKKQISQNKKTKIQKNISENQKIQQKKKIFDDSLKINNQVLQIDYQPSQDILIDKKYSPFLSIPSETSYMSSRMSVIE